MKTGVLQTGIITESDFFSNNLEALTKFYGKNENHLSKLKKDDYAEFAKKFYLDALMFDQNACSSPHLIIWFGKKNKNSYDKFWNNFWWVL